MTEAAEIQFGPFRLLGRQGPLLRGETEIRLQPKALAVLWTLARQAGEVCDRFTEGFATPEGFTTLDLVAVAQLRQALAT